MKRMRIRNLLRRNRSEEGGATVEFVIVFPVFIAVVFAAFEGGLLMSRQMMVERAVDVAMRDVRLGLLIEPGYDTLRDRICDTANVVKNCSQNLVVSTQVLDVGDAVDTTPTECFDRTATQEELDAFNPADGHNTGGSSQIVVVKVCAIVDPIFKDFGLTTILRLDESGGFPIRTASAFLHEPY
ncbi:MAG: TadE family protein [Pseudomonadota bacterium]